MFNQFISFLENDTLYSTPKLSDLHTLSQRKQLENHTLQGGTYLHSPYLAVPPPPPPPVPVLVQLFDVSFHFECGKFFISHTNTHVALGRTEVKFLRSV